MKQEHLEVVEAIKSLRPGYKFSFGKTRSGEQTILPEYLDWLENPVDLKPTPEEIRAEIVRLASVKYKTLRAAEYPPLSEFADAMYWASQGDNSKLEEYNAKCEAVKLKYPKPEVI